MRGIQIVLLSSLLVSLSGCASVVSLHPLVLPNDKDAIVDPALVGTWEEVKAHRDGARTRYVVARAESGYTVDMGPGKLEGTMHVLKVGGRYLLDVYCPSDGPSLPVHLFVKLRLDKDSAWLAGMESEWLQDQIKTSAQLRHEVLIQDDDRMVLTASPAELRQHLLPYVADDRSFGGETELRRIQLATQPATAKPPFRVGVFDSRAVALAWGRSDEGMQVVKQIRAEYEKAKAANDEKRMKEMEQEGQWHQVRMHQLVFSTGPVAGILAKVKEKLPEIARQERVTAIVSKWELPYSEPGTELVDVTLALVKLFNPSEQVLKWVEELKNQAPTPFDKLPLDPNL